MAGEKTEKASPKKKRDERKKGNAFQSADIVSVFSILGIFMLVKLIFPFIYSYMANKLTLYISYMRTETIIDTALVMKILIDGVITLFVTAGPIMLAAMFIGVVASGTQTRFIFAVDSIKPKFSRMSFGKGLKKLFSLRAIVELIKSLLKVILIGYVLYSGYMKITNKFMRLMSVSLEAGVVFILNSIMDIVMQIVLVFGIIAFFDFMYQWWDYEKNMRMSKQDLKEEYKHTEGDPQVKGKIKEKQREMSAQRMMQAVPTADVIVRNPTHFAVALKYDFDKDMAPVVVAKGQDLVALRIIEIAKANNIPMTENRPLARALYDSTVPNQPIPPQFYAVMAEIMAWVYKLKHKDKLKRRNPQT